MRARMAKVPFANGGERATFAGCLAVSGLSGDFCCRRPHSGFMVLDLHEMPASGTFRLSEE